MIYTVTLNPSLDYTVWLEDFAPGRINRTQRERVYPGGKGINVSVVLRRLGFDSRALGFCAGFTGQEIVRLVRKSGGEADFVQVKHGLSRINVKIKAGEESEINGSGPEIDARELEAFFAKLDALQAQDFLVLAGSVPACLPRDMYRRILQRAAEKGVRAAVDATGELLLNTLEYRPFLIKPNNHELSQIMGEELKGEREIVAAARRLQELGAQNVLVSMAGDGAVLVTDSGQVMSCAAPEGRVVNSVGAGDSMVAGFIAGYLEKFDLRHAFRLGLAAGSATAFDEWLAEKEDILKLYNNLD